MYRTFAWLSIVLLFLALRYQNIPGVFSDEGLSLNDTDPYYHLHRIESIARDKLTYPLHDEMLSYPRGFDVPWPTGLNLLLALPLRWFSVSNTTSIDAFSAVAIPLLSLPTLLFLSKIVGALGGPTLALIAGTILSFSTPHIYSSEVGRVDHHFLEGLFTILTLLSILRLRTSSRRREKFFFVSILALAPSFWPQAWVLALFAALSFGLDDQSANRNNAPKLFFWASLASLVPLTFSDRFLQGYLSIYGFSWITPAVYAAMSVLTVLLTWVEKRKVQISNLHVGIAVVATGIFVFLLVRNGMDWFGKTTDQAVNAVIAAKGTLSITSETTPTFQVSPKRWLPLGYAPLVLTWIWFTLQAFRRKNWWLVGYFLGPLALSAAQVRFMALMSPLMVLATVLLLAQLTERGLKSARVRNAVTAGCAALLIFFEFPQLGWTMKGNRHPFFKPVRSAALFLKELPFGPVLGHWDYGHWFVKYGSKPVIAHPFHDKGSVDALSLFCSRDLLELDRFLKTYPVRYFIAEAPTGRMTRWLDLLNRPKEPYFEKQDLSGANQFKLSPKPEFFRLFLPRFYFGGGVDDAGNFPAHWRMIYVSPFASPDDPRLPALKVFERVEGFRIRFSTDKGKHASESLWIHGQVRAGDGNMLFKRRAEKIGNGRYEWVVPYGSGDLPGVRFSGEYRVVNASGKTLAIVDGVSEKDVREGKEVDLGVLRW